MALLDAVRGEIVGEDGLVGQGDGRWMSEDAVGLSFL